MSATAWTGGQYSVLRALLGLYLAVHFTHLAFWGTELFSSQGVLPEAALSPFWGVPNLFWISDSAPFVTAVLGLAAVAGLLLGLGLLDRVAALFLWLVWVSVSIRNPLISNPGLPYVGLLLVVHALLPPAPYGSWAARGRVDPGGGWRHDRWLFAALWILMAAGYSYSGLTKLGSLSWVDGSALRRVLENPLARPGLLRDLLLTLPDGLLRGMSHGALAGELLFAPLVLLRRLRPWVWGAMLSMHLGLMALIDFADLSLGMVLLHLATFDPAWIRPRPGEVRIYYDGECGLCHRFVRFVLAEDPAGRFARFAALQGETFQRQVDSRARAALPDSVVVQGAEGRVAVRSEAALIVLRGLGGLWGALARALALLPTAVLDRAYDVLAARRRGLFARPSTACPMLPPDLAARFDP